MLSSNPDANANKGRLPVVGGYEIISKLGHGAVGYVYKARQVSVDRIVALKLLDTKFARDQTYVARFLREARSAGGLNHVNIVQGIDAGLAREGYYYFAMEFVEGETVRQMIKRLNTIPEGQAIEIACQMAQALRHAARIRLVHRDIKPENIIVTPAGVAKLADLGLAKSSVEDTSITQTGESMGTPLYISPEQARGEDDLDVRSDIYSLGATLYHMVAGMTPFSGENATVIILKHINVEPEAANRVNTAISEDLSLIIDKMLAKDRAGRYQTATELLDDLSALKAGGAPKLARAFARQKTARRVAPQPAVAVPMARRVKPRTAWVAAALVLVAAVGVYAIVAGGKRGHYQPPVVVPPPIGTNKAERELAAERLLAQGRDLEKLDMPGAISIYERVIKEHGGTAAATAAAGRVEAISRTLHDESQLKADQEAFRMLIGTVEDLKKSHDLRGAVEKVKVFLRESRHQEVVDKSSELLEQLRDELARYIDTLMANAQGLRKAGDFDKAVEVYRELDSLGYATVAKEGLDGVEAERKAAAAAHTMSAKEAHDRFWLQFAGRLREAGPAAARDYARAALDDPALVVARADLEWDLKLLDHLRTIDDDARAALKSLVGSTFPIAGKTPVLIAQADDNEFFIERAGVRIPKKFSSLPVDERFRLAEHHWQKTSKTDAVPRIVYHMCVTLDLNAAREVAAKTTLSDLDRKRFADRIERLVMEAEAKRLFESVVEDAKESGKSDAVRAHCRRLQAEFKDTYLMAQQGKQVDEMLRKAERRLLAVAIPKKLNGKAKLLDDGSWRFFWDFSEDRQLADFERGQPAGTHRDKVEPPAVRNRAITLKGIDIVAPVIFRGTPILIEYRLRLLEERADSGYGRVLIVSRTGNALWEFAYCHGSRKQKLPDFYRNLYTLGRTPAGCWKMDCFGSTLDRSRWHEVRCEITDTYARAWMDGFRAYDSSTVRIPGQPVDPSGLPDLAEPYQVQFSGWEPDDTWGFDDICITGPPDSAWLQTFLDPEPRQPAPDQPR